MSGAAALAALAGGAAVALLLPGRSTVGRLRTPSEASERAGPTPRKLLGVALWLGVAAATVVAGWAGFCLGGAAALVVWTASGLVVRQRGVRRAERLGADVGRAADVLAGLLRVGHVPSAALTAAAAECPVLAQPAAVQQVGGEVAPALLALAERHASPELATLGVTWLVSQRTGAAMAESMVQVAEGLASERELRHTVAAGLAAARATTRLMSALPVVGLLIGYAFGGDPAAFLVGTPGGQACLLVGVACACAGAWWGEAVAGRALQGEGSRP